MSHPAGYPAAQGGAERKLRSKLERQLGFDQADHVAIVSRLAPPHDQESVERVAVTRGVNLCLDNVEIRALEIAAYARKKLLAVRRIDHYLQTFTKAREAGAHDRLVGIHAVMEIAGLPGDVLRVMAQEIRRI